MKTKKVKKVKCFKEKKEDASTYLIFTGVGIVNPECLKHLDNVGKLELQLDKIAEKHGFKLSGHSLVLYGICDDQECRDSIKK